LANLILDVIEALVCSRHGSLTPPS
jgi:hypothetical protein